MVNACKKIAGFVCLATVVGVTAVAANISSPAQEASATGSDVEVQFTVSDKKYLVETFSPTEGQVFYPGATAKVKIKYTMASSITVNLIYPDGSTVLVDAIVSAEEVDTYEADLPITTFGEYTLRVVGTDTAGNQMPAQSTMFRYKGASITPPSGGDNGSGGENGGGEDGGNTEPEYSENITIGYGYGVCKIGVQAYEPTDTAKAHPLLNPEYMADVPAVEAGTLGEMTISRNQLGLDSKEYLIVIGIYDCLNEDIIDSDELIIPGKIEPPKTGAISILGITVSRADYIVTGLVAFVLVAGAAIFLLARRKKSTRRR